MRLPDAVDDVAAASLPIAYGTAYGALCWSGRLQPGETLMVHGAGGGVGLAAVECGHVLGATVIATARGAAHLDAARAHGADHADRHRVRGRARARPGADRGQAAST